jgi:type 1 glutamine amidotransferase
MNVLPAIGQLGSALLALLVSSGWGNACSAAPVPRVLILSGQNNHQWGQTSPKLQAILENCGQFVVAITEHPEQCDAAMFKKYDVLLSNWNTFGSPAVTHWPATTREAFLDFVRNGKGFVSIHAGSSSFANWPEYQQIAGGAWKLGATGHGPVHGFTVQLRDQDHPITRGMSEFFTTDELWHRTGLEANIHVLATAYSAADKQGTDREEPIAFTTSFGRGRGFNLLLGHDAPAMESPGFQRLLKRGVEWAATGAVLESPPPQDPSRVLAKESTQAAYEHKGNLLWKWVADPAQGKPYFHPLMTTDGTPLTALRPADHPWHRGLWWSWKFINGVNYWEEDRNTELSAGQTIILSHLTRETPEGGAEIESVLSYQPPGEPSLLREIRSVRISSPDAAGDYWMDWKSEFLAGAKPVQLDRTPTRSEPGGARWGGYAGLSVRLDSVLSDGVFRNSEGQIGVEATHGKSARWMDVGNARGGIAIFDHPANLRHPTPWYVDAKMPFFSPALLFNAPHTLPRGATLTLRYRILVHAHPKTPVELESVWQEFCRADVHIQTRGNPN